MSSTEKTKIIFYSETDQIKERFDEFYYDLVHFNGYQVIFDSQLLLKQLPDASKKILFVIIPNFKISSRLFIQQLSKRFPNLTIVLCSNVQFALDAWKFNLLYFLSFPISNSEINFALKKYLRKINKDEAIPLRIKINGENHLISPSNILFCKADGNYTWVHSRNDGKYLVSLQLNKIVSRLSGNLGIQRVGKSYLINLDNILSIGKGKVLFNNKTTELLASDHYIRKIQKILTGYYK